MVMFEASLPSQATTLVETVILIVLGRNKPLLGLKGLAVLAISQEGRKLVKVRRIQKKRKLARPLQRYLMSEEQTDRNSPPEVNLKKVWKPGPRSSTRM